MITAMYKLAADIVTFIYQVQIDSYYSVTRAFAKNADFPEK